MIKHESRSLVVGPESTSTLNAGSTMFSYHASLHWERACSHAIRANIRFHSLSAVH